MNNKEIAKLFSELADLMELQNENPFKIKSYRNAHVSLRKIDTPLNTLSQTEMEVLPGVGKAIAEKITQIVSTGKMPTLEKYRALVPEGVREMLKVHGLGPKKIDVIWRKLGIESPGELLYACDENRLVELPGFGTKTQEDVKSKLAFYFNASGKYLYPKVSETIQTILDELNEKYPRLNIQFTGELCRKCQIIEKIELVCNDVPDLLNILAQLGDVAENYEGNLILSREDFDEIIIIPASEDSFGTVLFETTGPSEFVEKFRSHYQVPKNIADESAVFEAAQLDYFPPVLRDNDFEVDNFLKDKKTIQLIEYKDIKGIVHNHSTWSDGIHTLHEMSEHVKSNGFEYFVISDHSKSAFYANGLSEERVRAQWNEIESLNKEYMDFKIYKSIESDILSDGSLDYPDEVLAGFDLVIASVHSNLNMDIDKAMKRLITAVENPFTRILGHPTGRLLLARKGYPVDHARLIDACAANNVAIELNANPLRLDLDWSWIPYAMQKSVLIAINPDAHNKSGIFDIRFGINAAQKGGLTADACLNSMSRSRFEHWLHNK